MAVSRREEVLSTPAAMVGTAPIEEEEGGDGGGEGRRRRRREGGGGGEGVSYVPLLLLTFIDGEEGHPHDGVNHMVFQKAVGQKSPDIGVYRSGVDADR